ncbi:three-Cys-motif partner protein [Chitinophaga niastensis]|uniref:Three-Cys-motif partner protein n=1 Tax=Chitinophaga niastensis TaxID=536980 RepID=A0A2P8H7U6_CHINA|nr:three-Cys-motif partner protein TcmP [Chitinophaga niastensis]PSL42296.1 three-Cys-motif partner protein [Chitinophaga niastensis]
MNKLDVKTNLLDHSEAKVRLLGEYVKRYLNIISNDGYTEVINMHDLFCGPGLYDNGGHGSPLVILKHVKQTYYTIIDKSSRKRPKINCYFNDLDKSKTEILNQSIKDGSLHYPVIGELNLSNNDYKVAVVDLKDRFEKFKNEKSFVFIDPYGYKELVAGDIQGLLGKHKKSEVLIWLPIQFMYRFADEGTPAVLKNFMTELGIMDEAKKTKNVWEFISLLNTGFQNFLGNAFFVDHFSLKKEENTVFCLFFFTSHIKGFEKMLESKWEIDTEQGRGWQYSGIIPSLFSEQKTNELEATLKSFLKTGRKYNSDVYEFVLRQGYLTKHATEVLSNLQKNGQLQVFLGNGTAARKNSFYIKYHKPSDIDNKKVYFALN